MSRCENVPDRIIDREFLGMPPEIKARERRDVVAVKKAIKLSPKEKEADNGGVGF